MTYFLGIDLGTSSVKAILIDEKGRVLSKSSENYPLHFPYPGWVEQNPGDWWNATKKVLKKLILNSQIEPSKIQGIGLSGQTHSTVVLDKIFFLCGTLLLDTARRRWSEEILEKLEISENRLPSLYESTEVTGYVNKDGAEESALLI